MTKIHASSTYAKATITIAAVGAVLAVALIAASPAQAVCTPSGTPGGGPGNDVLCGTAGTDVLFGLAGDDRLTGEGGNDTLDGGVGNDTVIGSAGNDLLFGGTGFDLFSGGAQNDRLRARDGNLDGITFSCGLGTDSLDMDLVDFGAINLTLGVALLSSGCESISVGAVNEGPNVVIPRRSVRVGVDGRVAVRLRCPASLAAPCAGRLRIGRSTGSEGTPKAYSIDQGERENVSVRLSRRDRLRLRRQGRITVRATSVEQGAFGKKTTVQTLALIARA